MAFGVTFEPGTRQRQQGQGGTAQPGNGVQEAIKVLSLRLPRVVGAQALAPSGLLNAQGSGGNPSVDGIVSRILAKVLPGGVGAQPGGVPSVPAPAGAGPTFEGAPGGGMPPNMPLSRLMPPEAFAPSGPRPPRITPADPTERPPVMPGEPPLPDYVDREVSSPGTKTPLPPEPAPEPMPELPGPTEPAMPPELQALMALLRRKQPGDEYASPEMR